GRRATLLLAFLCMGVIYCHMATSPLYVFSATSPDGIRDGGGGGTFALYSLMCRHANLSFKPNQQHEDIQLSSCRLESPPAGLAMAQKVKERPEKSKTAKFVLFLPHDSWNFHDLGDGVLTPCISVILGFFT
ncbi:potassium transporter 5-like, partial [Dorcoceras hygrometricum]